VLAGITALDSECKLAIVAVRVVRVVRGDGRRRVMIVVAVRRRSVLMLGMLVWAVRMHVRRRDRGRRDRDDHRKHVVQEATHDDESTTTARIAVNRGPAARYAHFTS
jgi:hypothetical protein